MRVNKYIGMRYNRDTFDCADFAILVQREMFGREISLPAARPRISGGGQRHVRDISLQYAEPTECPKDGDLVLMRQLGRKRATHIGVYFNLDGDHWVLHCSEDTKASVIERIREIQDSSIDIEGYYTWRNI